MPHIILPDRSRRAPERPMRLRSAHPLVNGSLEVFVALSIPGVPVNLVNGERGTGVIPYAVSRMAVPKTDAVFHQCSELVGRAFDATTNYIEFSLSGGTAPWTLSAGAFAADGSIVQTTAPAVCNTHRNNVLGNTQQGCSLIISSDERWGIQNTSSSSATNVLHPTSQSGAVVHRYSGVFEGNASRWSLHGLEPSSQNTISRTWNYAQNKFVIGAKRTALADPFYSGFWEESIEYAAAWNGAMPHDALRELHLNPWAMLERDTFRTYFFPSSSVGIRWLRIPHRMRSQPL